MKVTPKFFSEEECSKLLLFFKEQELQTATIVGHFECVPETRKTKIFLWEYDVKLEMKFQATPMSFQFAEYSIGDHYDWHHDYDTHNNKKRIETCVINLNNEYEGGEFELEDHGKIELNVGDCLRFDSKLYHKVHPVTKGKRYSMVGWVYEPYSIEKLMRGVEEFCF